MYANLCGYRSKFNRFRITTTYFQTFDLKKLRLTTSAVWLTFDRLLTPDNLQTLAKNDDYGEIPKTVKFEKLDFENEGQGHRQSHLRIF